MNNPPELRHILVIEDQKSRRIVPLVETTYAIGRDPNSAILLYDRQVSRHHATLLRVTDYQTDHYSYRIIDGNLQGKRSTNGIIINSKYCLSHELENGDQIRFGSKSTASYHILSSESEMDLLKMGGEPAMTNPNTTESDAIEDSGEESMLLGAFPLETLAPELPEKLLELENHQEENYHTLVFKKAIEDHNETALMRLSSLAEYSPYPIIEVNSAGKILYINPIAKIKFPNLSPEHSIFIDIFSNFNNQERTSLVREVQVGYECFEQHLHYLADSKVVRIYLFDITKYQKLEAQINLSNERYQLLVKASSEGILILDANTKQVLEANPAYCRLSGYSLAEIVELDIYKLIALDRDILTEELEQIQLESSSFIEESFHRGKSGSLISVAMQVSRIHYKEKEVFCLAVRDITEQKQTEEKLNYQTLHDELTHLPNRHFFEKQLATALKHAQKHQHLLGVIFLDLDSFANINNTLGHPIGDRVLHDFSQRLNGSLRAGDIASRWGSDEFALLLPQIKNTEDAIKVAQRIFDNLEKPFKIDDHLLRVKASLGIAIYPQDGDDQITLLKNADTALHRTKQTGRNHYQFYSPPLTTEASLLLNLESLLHQALERRQFSLDYQPQIHCKTGRITGMEALLRWEHPELGLIAPQKFLPLAQKTDVILHLTKWVLTAACQQNLSWQKDKLPPFPIAVNLSAREFQQPNLPEVVARVLNETGLDPQWLELELTEPTLRQNTGLAQKTLRDLHHLGVRIALDDFGIGYSALGYLTHFPLHTLKIAQTFIRDLRGTPPEISMISAIVALGQGFDLRVIAEGVETQQQHDILIHHHCEEIQGYWYSRPLNAKAITQFLSEKNQQEIELLSPPINSLTS